TIPLWGVARTRPESLLSDGAPPPFLLSPGELRKLLEIAIGRGGDFAEIYMEHTVSNSIGLDENVVSGASRNVDMGVGFRVLKGEATGYAFSDVLEFGRLKAAAQTAALVASGAPAPVRTLKAVRPPSYYLVKVPPDS